MYKLLLIEIFEFKKNRNYTESKSQISKSENLKRKMLKKKKQMRFLFFIICFQRRYFIVEFHI